MKWFWRIASMLTLPVWIITIPLANKIMLGRFCYHSFKEFIWEGYK